MPITGPTMLGASLCTFFSCCSCYNYTCYTSQEQLVASEFAVQRSKGNTYRRIPHDQAIEVTMNKGIKSQGGIIDISLRPAAVFKWRCLEQPVLSSLVSVKKWQVQHSQK